MRCLETIAGSLGLVFAAALLPGALGCSASQSCTAIGCTDQLAIRLSPSFAATYTMDLVLDGKAASFRCEAGRPLAVQGNLVVASCADDGAVLIASPTSVTVTVKAIPMGDGGPSTAPSDRTGTFTPTYTVSQPNGPDCTPTCKMASVTPQ